jgi:hypothetical protein
MAGLIVMFLLLASLLALGVYVIIMTKKNDKHFSEAIDEIKSEIDKVANNNAIYQECLDEITKMCENKVVRFESPKAASLLDDIAGTIRSYTSKLK